MKSRFYQEKIKLTSVYV